MVWDRGNGLPGGFWVMEGIVWVARGTARGPLSLPVCPGPVAKCCLKVVWLQVWVPWWAALPPLLWVVCTGRGSRSSSRVTLAVEGPPSPVAPCAVVLVLARPRWLPVHWMSRTSTPVSKPLLLWDLWGHLTGTLLPLWVYRCQWQWWFLERIFRCRWRRNHCPVPVPPHHWQSPADTSPSQPRW